jgi:hypothetical protein
MILAAGCSASDRQAGPPPTPANVSLEEFQALRWLQGTWRGQEDGGAPFFESYVFLDDSTIRSFSYPDSTFAEAADSGTIAWSGRRITTVAGRSAWVVTRFDSLGIRFEPVRKAATAYTWSRESRSAWTVRSGPPGETATSQGHVYRMARVGS